MYCKQRRFSSIAINTTILLTICARMRTFVEPSTEGYMFATTELVYLELFQETGQSVSSALSFSSRLASCSIRALFYRRRYVRAEWWRATGDTLTQLCTSRLES